MRSLALLIVIAGCASWRGAEVTAVAPHQRYQLFVVTPGEAYELQDGRSDGKLVRGSVVRAWQYAPKTSFELYRGEEPSDVAERLGWHPVATHAPDFAVPVERVQHVKIRERGWSGWKIAGVAGMGTGLALMYGMIGLLIAGGGGSGRPFRVDGRQKFPRVARSTDWTAPIEVMAVDEDERAKLAELWIDDARAEHASVAAFSKLTLELLALGAPPHLVARASHAATQEVEHARLCFAIASAYRGAPLGPSPLPEAVIGEAVDLERLARESLLDGVMCEGIAAEMARLGAASARDPEIARVLRIIAHEEAQHAELGWAIVEWCVGKSGDELRAQLHAALADAVLPRCHDLPAHGRIGKRVLEPRFEELRMQTRRRLEDLRPQRGKRAKRVTAGSGTRLECDR